MERDDKLQIIAVANDKGGVAKTTTAISLGGALAQMGHETLLIDLDPQASLTLALGIPPHKVKRGIADLLINTASPVSVSCETAVPGLDMIPSNDDMRLAERFLPIRADYRHILRKAVQTCHYDFVILDCPPSLGAIVQNALVAATLLIIPTSPDFLSAYALRNMLSTVRNIREKENPKLNYRVLVTMLDLRVKSHSQFSKKLKRTFKHAIFETAIQVDTRLRDSAMAGLPITHYLASTRSAEQYRALAQELLHYV
jgi:chromosome partitioning protein